MQLKNEQASLPREGKPTFSSNISYVDFVYGIGDLIEIAEVKGVLAFLEIDKIRDDVDPAHTELLRIAVDNVSSKLRCRLLREDYCSDLSKKIEVLCCCFQSICAGHYRYARLLETLFSNGIYGKRAQNSDKLIRQMMQRSLEETLAFG